MSLCVDCSKSSENIKKAMTRLEIVHTLAGIASLARYIHHGGVGREQDKMISSSVMTKFLYALDADQREPILRNLRETVGLDITLSSCPHGKIAL